VTQVVEIQDPAERSRIAEAVLRDLPEWFGIEESTRQYIEDAATLPTLVVEPDAGFLCLKQHTPRAAEIYVMGVRRAQHRKGIGRALVAAAESWCRVRGIPYLHVKTLGPSRPDPGYDATRSFYEAVGFVALEELHGLWGRGQPDARPRQGRSARLHCDARRRACPSCARATTSRPLIAERAELVDGDVVVVAQKAVSKTEGPRR
jgi:GNAT superfamily N-acetyltransferase